MILDLHVHTKKSGDAAPQVEEYARWVVDMRESYRIDGFVVTEHRLYDPLIERYLRILSNKYNMKIFQGVEAHTDYGHILVFGITPAMSMAFDFSKDRLNAKELVDVAEEFGAVVAPAHPGRPSVGGGEFIFDLKKVKIVEALNGGSDRGENSRALAIMEKGEYFGIGGSDAHYVTDFGLCLTKFKRKIHTQRDFVSELRKGDYEPIYLEKARKE